jgi:polyisoprenoid-binding protein YceI
MTQSTQAASVQSAVAIPGYKAGTWAIDQVHSEVGFTVRHMMVSKVRGRFGTFSGEFVTGETPTQSTVSAEIDLRSIDTNNEQRDEHIRSADFFEVDKYPTMTYRSTGIREDGDGGYLVDGELTLKGVTKPVELQLEIGGFGPDAYGGYRAGFSAQATINRRDFGVNFNAALETGGAVVGDKVTIHLEIEGVLNA